MNGLDLWVRIYTKFYTNVVSPLIDLCNEKDYVHIKEALQARFPRPDDAPERAMLLTRLIANKTDDVLVTHLLELFLFLTPEEEEFIKTDKIWTEKLKPYKMAFALLFEI